MIAERLRLVADAIAAHPDHFDMGNWFGDDDVVSRLMGGEIPELTADGHPGTTACVGGWAIVLFPDDGPLPPFTHWNGWAAAAERLGLNPDQAGDLFSSEEWWGRAVAEADGVRLVPEDCPWIDLDEITADTAARVLRAVADHHIEL